MPSLEIADSVPQIGEAFDSLIASKCPGFQISSNVQTDEALTVLEKRMTVFNKHFRFDDKFNGDSSPNDTFHIDINIVEDGGGLALHETRRGIGSVALILVKPNGVSHAYTREVDIAGLEAMGLTEGEVFTGEVKPGLKTVFSEGILVPEANLELGPTVHRFLNEEDSFRQYTRHSWSGSY
jgi:hypothetical protein